MRTLLEELELYRPLPQCTCHVACVCLAMRNARSFKLEDSVIQFLIGLNNEYQGMKSQVLLLMESLPTMCDICHKSRQKRLLFSISNSNEILIFDLVHLDIWGPFSTKSVHGYKYFLTILDDCSRHVWVVMLRLKYEVPNYVKFSFPWSKHSLVKRWKLLEVTIDQSSC